MQAHGLSYFHQETNISDQRSQHNRQATAMMVSSKLLPTCTHACFSTNQTPSGWLRPWGTSPSWHGSRLVPEGQQSFVCHVSRTHVITHGRMSETWLRPRGTSPNGHGDRLVPQLYYQRNLQGLHQITGTILNPKLCSK